MSGQIRSATGLSTKYECARMSMQASSARAAFAALMDNIANRPTVQIKQLTRTKAAFSAIALSSIKTAAVACLFSLSHRGLGLLPT